jgi:hypothetical protein
MEMQKGRNKQAWLIETKRRQVRWSLFGFVMGAKWGINHPSRHATKWVKKLPVQRMLVLLGGK